MRDVCIQNSRTRIHVLYLKLQIFFKFEIEESWNDEAFCEIIDYIIELIEMIE